MAVGFRTWTVLPHEPVEVLAPNLWRLEGVLNAVNRRVMVLIRLDDGRVVVHNPVAMDDPSMAKLDAWGEVAAILAPNAFHRQDTFIWQQRYPKAKVYAPRGAVKAVSKATSVHGTWEEAPRDGYVSYAHIEGVAEREGLVKVESGDGATLVFCDTLLNLPRTKGVLGALLYPTGVLSVPRPTALWFARDKPALSRQLASLAGTYRLARIIPGHGTVVTNAPAGQLREAADRIR